MNGVEGREEIKKKKPYKPTIKTKHHRSTQPNQPTIKPTQKNKPHQMAWGIKKKVELGRESWEGV